MCGKSEQNDTDHPQPSPKSSDKDAVQRLDGSGRKLKI